MASSHGTVRNGPCLNTKWLNAFSFIEKNQIEQALGELTNERRNWLQRPDLIIRAARHYEGAMLAFIRLATSCFKSDIVESSLMDNNMSYKVKDIVE